MYDSYEGFPLLNYLLSFCHLAFPPPLFILDLIRSSGEVNWNAHQAKWIWSREKVIYRIDEKLLIIIRIRSCNISPSVGFPNYSWMVTFHMINLHCFFKSVSDKQGTLVLVLQPKLVFNLPQLTVLRMEINLANHLFGLFDKFIWKGWLKKTAAGSYVCQGWGYPFTLSVN